MSVDPLNILNNSLLENSDIIFIHHEIKNREMTIQRILEKKKIPGLVLHCVNPYENLEEIIGNFKEILVLSIKKPGQSGQVFEDKSYSLINRINLLKERKSLNLCVDGGVKSNLINKFISEKVVSGSDVLNSSYPIKKIMKHQTVARYEK